MLHLLMKASRLVSGSRELMMVGVVRVAVDRIGVVVMVVVTQYTKQRFGE